MAAVQCGLRRPYITESESLETIRKVKNMSIDIINCELHIEMYKYTKSSLMEKAGKVYSVRKSIIERRRMSTTCHVRHFSRVKTFCFDPCGFKGKNGIQHKQLKVLFEQVSPSNIPYMANIKA